jgi:hypothetical protein
VRALLGAFREEAGHQTGSGRVLACGLALVLLLC